MRSRSHFSGVSASAALAAALAVSAAARAGVRAFFSSAASTITFAIIHANADRGDVSSRRPGLAMSRAALGAIGVTADNAAGNTDGIHPDSTSNMLVERATVSVGDDAVAITSGEMYQVHVAAGSSG